MYKREVFDRSRPRILSLHILHQGMSSCWVFKLRSHWFFFWIILVWYMCNTSSRKSAASLDKLLCLMDINTVYRYVKGNFFFNSLNKNNTKKYNISNEKLTAVFALGLQTAKLPLWTTYIYKITLCIQEYFQWKWDFSFVRWVWN